MLSSRTVCGLLFCLVVMLASPGLADCGGCGGGDETPAATTAPATGVKEAPSHAHEHAKAGKPTTSQSVKRETMSLDGTYVRSKKTLAVAAVFTAAGPDAWSVVWIAKWKGKDHRYVGTAKGNATTGVLTGSAAKPPTSKDKRVFSFRVAKDKAGAWSGAYFRGATPKATGGDPLTLKPATKPLKIATTQPAGDGVVRLQGKFNRGGRGSYSLTGEFTPVGQGKWTCKWSADYKDKTYAYVGTAIGDPATEEVVGRSAQPEGSKDKRVFSFRLKLKDGKVTGTHYRGPACEGKVGGSIDMGMAGAPKPTTRERKGAEQ